MSCLLHTAHQIITLCLFDLRISYRRAGHRAQYRAHSGLVATFSRPKQSATNASNRSAALGVALTNLARRRTALGLVTRKIRAPCPAQL